MSNHIFLIPSFPKSGNTLMRMIISSLFFTKNGFIDLKNIRVDQLENVDYLNLIKEINNNDYYQLDKLSILYKYHLNIKEKSNLNFNEDFGFFKTHHALINFNKFKYINQEFLRGYIYLIRDPRDIVVSWANHVNSSLSDSVEFILNDKSCINWARKKKSVFPKQIKPLLLTSNWENHVLSWTENSLNVPKMIIRYEDLISNKENIILQMINFFKTNFNIEPTNIDIKIKNILKTSDFNYLTEVEKKEGFEERVEGKFFNKGTSNQWKDKLTKDQINKINNRFMLTMKKFNYS